MQIKTLENMAVNSNDEIRQLEESFRKQLSEARKNMNITQSELRKKTGFTQQVISRIETNNDISPSLKNVIKYLNAVGYDLSIMPKEKL